MWNCGNNVDLSVSISTTGQLFQTVRSNFLLCWTCTKTLQTLWSWKQMKIISRRCSMNCLDHYVTLHSSSQHLFIGLCTRHFLSIINFVLKQMRGLLNCVFEKKINQWDSWCLKINLYIFILMYNHAQVAERCFKMSGFFKKFPEALPPGLKGWC